jgi:uncharacterized protein (TIGR02677 family)
MSLSRLPAAASSLFSHVSADKAAEYRAIMEVFVAAKRQFRLHLRPDEVQAEAAWPGSLPNLDAVQQSLAQLIEWGNLQAQPDTARVATIEDFYRKRLLYRMSVGGEAVEAGLETFIAALARRAELQSVALDDILARLNSLGQLARTPPVDAAKAHEALRDLVNVFKSLADNAEAFMAGLARTLELQRGEAAAVMAFKSRLIDYLQRFIGDLVTRSGQIADLLQELRADEALLLGLAADREARDAAPGDAAEERATIAARLDEWRERWAGLRRWFISDQRSPSQAALLRKTALAAIPRLLQAISLVNERRTGRSDRAADFRRLAIWFAGAEHDAAAHRLWRTAFALSPARHLTLAVTGEDPGASTGWQAAPPIDIYPQLREQGMLPTRGAAPKIADRSRERALLGAHLAQEFAQTEAARQRLATGRETLLSELGVLDAHAFRLFLTLLGEALAAQTHPTQVVERLTGDGSLRIRLEPLAGDTHAEIETELGRFGGRDFRVSIHAA